MEEGKASGVPREAFQPGNLAFPPISSPARAPRPLFSPSSETLHWPHMSSEVRRFAGRVRAQELLEAICESFAPEEGAAFRTGGIIPR